MFFVEQTRLAELAAKNRLPSIAPQRELAGAGYLMAYGVSVLDVYRRTAVYVDKILRGAKPDDLPVEQATKFELVVNLRTATVLGLTVPQFVLLRADEVIQWVAIGKSAGSKRAPNFTLQRATGSRCWPLAAERGP